MIIKKLFRRSRLLGFFMATFLLSPTVLWAQYPDKPVRIVVPFAPGGSNDVVARIVGQQLGERLGQSFVIENKPGASGTIGADAVAKAASDGYTLLVSSGTPIAASPHLYSKLPYDPAKDFTPIVRIATQSAVMMVRADSKFSDVSQLVAAARAKPGTLTFGTSGVGSTEHIATTRFMMATGIDMVHVPYKGTAPAITDLIGGSIDLIFVPVPTSLPHIQSGKLRALAVSTLARSSSLPDVPTLNEAGIKNFEALTWIGLLGPAGLQNDVVKKLNNALNDAFKQDDGAAQLHKLGLDVAVGTAPEFKEFIAEDSENYAKIVKAAGIPKQ